MSDYRRWYVPGGTYYFTLVTYGRQRLFRDGTARELLGSVFREVASELPFETVAIVLLWDHMHCVWTLPRGDDGYSDRWKKIKSRFTKQWLDRGGRELQVTQSQKQHGRRGIWQRRFWEHVVDSEEELAGICDYIHYNPVKHRYVARPTDWAWSSFHRFVAAGEYPIDWGRSEPANLKNWKLDMGEP
jgi:putative transposase